MPPPAESEQYFGFRLQFRYEFGATAKLCPARQISQAHQRFGSWRGISILLRLASSHWSDQTVKPRPRVPRLEPHGSPP